MAELGGPESYAPDEGGGGGGEQVSEAAREAYRASQQAAAQAQQREERKAKKRDDRVAQAILAFLTDTQRAHLSIIISRLVARDCPSPFLLAILSLINEECKKAFADFLQEQGESVEAIVESAAGALHEDLQKNRDIVEWTTRMEMAMARDWKAILNAVVVGEGSVDGTMLQLASFVLEEYLKTQNAAASFEQAQALSMQLLQTMLEPYMERYMEEKAAEMPPPSED